MLLQGFAHNSKPSQHYLFLALVPKQDMAVAVVAGFRLWPRLKLQWGLWLCVAVVAAVALAVAVLLAAGACGHGCGFDCGHGCGWGQLLLQGFAHNSCPGRQESAFEVGT